MLLCLCQKPCSGWYQNIRNGHCYRAFCELKNFNDAQKACEGLGAHLAHIRNEYENKFVATLKYGLPESEENYWIGIRRKSKGSNEWIYEGTDETVKYLNFHANRPDNEFDEEDCVHYVYWNHEWWHQWNDWQCWKNSYYICERHDCTNLPF